MPIRLLMTLLFAAGFVTPQERSPIPDPRFLLQERRVSDDITSLLVQVTATGIALQLYGQSYRDGTPNPRPWSKMTTQAWFLLKDGGTLKQAHAPMNVGIGKSGESTDIMTFGFARAEPKELAGVVVSVNGKMIVREIK